MNRKTLVGVLAMLLITMSMLSGCQQAATPSATATPEVTAEPAAAEPTEEPAAAGDAN